MRISQPITVPWTPVPDTRPVPALRVERIAAMPRLAPEPRTGRDNGAYTGKAEGARRFDRGHWVDVLV